MTLACDAFGWLVAAHIGQGGPVETIGRPLVERWIGGMVYRLELHARGTGAAPDDYACTVIAAVVGERQALFVQIGDGAIVLSARPGWKHVFWPRHGEFANTTNFIISAHRCEAREFETTGEPVEELAFFSDDFGTLVPASRRPA